jgi:hypothetical protein
VLLAAGGTVLMHFLDVIGWAFALLAVGWLLGFWAGRR